MSTDLAERSPAELAELEAQVAGTALAGLDSDDLVLPILKVTQALSAEVASGEAKQGEFVNSLTGVNHGESVDFIVSGYFKGRFYEDKGDNKVYVAQGDVVPSNWPEEYAGLRFDEVPDAEERWKADANAEPPVHPWGSGPPIQTTHNYIGVVIDPENPDGADLPVRLSLKSTGARVHRRISTLLQFAGTPWSNVLSLKTNATTGAGDKRYYEVVANRGRPTDSEERQAAVKLAQQFQQSQNVQLQGEAQDRAGEREAAQGADDDALAVA